MFLVSLGFKKGLVTSPHLNMRAIFEYSTRSLIYRTFDAEQYSNMDPIFESLIYRTVRIFQYLQIRKIPDSSRARNSPHNFQQDLKLIDYNSTVITVNQITIELMLLPVITNHRGDI